MNYIRSGFFLLLLLILFPPGSFSQTGRPFDPLVDDISLKLPPLEQLIDSAMAHDPYVHFRQLQVAVNQFKTRDYQYQWSRNFGFQANLGYGTFDYLYTNTLGGQTPPTYTTQQNLTQYGVGAYIRFPIFDLIGRNNQVSMAKTEVQQAQQMIEVQAKELRQRVIIQYNDLIVKQHLLKIRGKYLETSMINIQMVEKEFTNGTISVSEFSRISEIVTKAETDVETTKMEFRTAYMLLEELVGMKFNIY